MISTHREYLLGQRLMCDDIRTCLNAKPLICIRFDGQMLKQSEPRIATDFMAIKTRNHAVTKFSIQSR